MFFSSPASLSLTQGAIKQLANETSHSTCPLLQFGAALVMRRLSRILRRGFMAGWCLLLTTQGVNELWLICLELARSVRRHLIKREK